MLPNKIPVVTVNKGGAVGTPEDFEARYERRRKQDSRQVQRQTAPQPRLKPIESHNMSDLLERSGLADEVR